MILVSDRVKDCNTDEVGTVISVTGQWITVKLDNGDEKIYTEAELYPNIPTE